MRIKKWNTHGTDICGNISFPQMREGDRGGIFQIQCYNWGSKNELISMVGLEALGDLL